MREYAVVIPAYKPDNTLLTFVDALIQQGLKHILIINDGNAEGYMDIFNQLSQKAKTVVLTHDQNLGKGAGLKTAFKYVLEADLPVVGVVTADADGQHKVADVVKVGENLLEYEPSLVLGVRNFDLDHVPLRSKVGNKASTLVFDMLFSYYLVDTQTGLRGIHKRELGWLVDLEGDRFEYEINMLIEMSKQRLSYTEVEIQTVYEADHSSHYATVKDSLAIAQTMLKAFLDLP